MVEVPQHLIPINCLDLTSTFIDCGFQAIFYLPHHRQCCFCLSSTAIQLHLSLLVSQPSPSIPAYLSRLAARLSPSQSWLWNLLTEIRWPLLELLYFKDWFFPHYSYITCICVGVCTHECRYHQKPKEGAGSPGDMDIGSCDLQTWGLGISSQILLKNRACF